MPRLPTGGFEARVLTCSVLVVSCDSYRDLWKPFFNLFARYWPDCPFPVYLGTNFANIEEAGITSLHAGQDKSWSINLRLFLEQIPTEYVLVMLEDFFLDRMVQSSVIQRHLSFLHTLGGAALRLFPNPPLDNLVPGEPGVGTLHPMASYRVSLQAAIWDKTKLLSLLRDEESAWEFEWHGTKRSQSEAGGYYCVKDAAIHYQHVVERGEWFRSAARRYQREQIGCDMTARRVMNPARALMKRVTNAVRRTGRFLSSKRLTNAL